MEAHKALVDKVDSDTSSEEGVTDVAREDVEVQNQDNQAHIDAQANGKIKNLANVIISWLTIAVTFIDKRQC